MQAHLLDQVFGGNGGACVTSHCQHQNPLVNAMMHAILGVENMLSHTQVQEIAAPANAPSVAQPGQALQR